MVIVKRFPDTMTAHIARSILAEEGIEAFVADENLANADPPVVFASGGVRLMVPNEDEERAHEILLKMDAGQLHMELPDDFDPGKDTLHQLPPKRPARSKGFSLAALLIAFALGAGAAHLYYKKSKRLAVTDGEVPFDSNRDQVYDGAYTYKGGELVSSTDDANLDGETDVEYTYQDGMVVSAKADRDSDGRYETTIKFSDHNNYLIESDINGDGGTDLVIIFENGGISKMEWYELGELRKTANFDAFGRKLNESFDADGDGSLDSFREFDKFEEEKKIAD